MISIRSFPFGVVYFQQKNAVSQGVRYLYTSPKLNSSPLKSYHPKRKGSSSNFRECIFPTICSSTDFNPKPSLKGHCPTHNQHQVRGADCEVVWGSHRGYKLFASPKTNSLPFEKWGDWKTILSKVTGKLFLPVPFVLGEWFCWVLGVSSWWKLTTKLVFQVASFFFGGVYRWSMSWTLGWGISKGGKLELEMIISSWIRITKLRGAGGLTNISHPNWQIYYS